MERDVVLIESDITLAWNERKENKSHESCFACRSGAQVQILRTLNGNAGVMGRRGAALGVCTQGETNAPTDDDSGDSAYLIKSTA